jgi:hypothetical protein
MMGHFFDSVSVHLVLLQGYLVVHLLHFDLLALDKVLVSEVLSFPLHHHLV